MEMIDMKTIMDERALEGLKKWNLDGMKFTYTEEDFILTEDEQITECAKQRMIYSLEFYFAQLERAKKEIRGIFTEDEILKLMNETMSFLYTPDNTKEQLVETCCYDFTWEGIYRDDELFEKMNALTEMQMHALLCIIKETTGEFDIDELFGVKKVD